MAFVTPQKAVVGYVWSQTVRHYSWKRLCIRLKAKVAPLCHSGLLVSSPGLRHVAGDSCEQIDMRERDCYRAQCLFPTNKFLPDVAD